MKLTYYPDPILFQETQPIEKVDDEVKAIASEMILIMNYYRGIGLAAPQVGLSKQIIVINPTGEPGKERVLLNPKILKRKGRVLGEEGCLCFPGLFANVMRSQWIQISALLLTEEEITFEAKDIEARVLQHETDHLHGILFVDKVVPAEEVIVKRKLKEIERIIAEKKKISVSS